MDGYEVNFKIRMCKVLTFTSGHCRNLALGSQKIS